MMALRSDQSSRGADKTTVPGVIRLAGAIACLCSVLQANVAAQTVESSAASKPVPSAASEVHVRMKTALGNIDIMLDARRAPLSTSNFLRYVRAGLYDGGVFHRTVTLSNQPANRIKIEVIQAAANPARTNQFFPPIQLERTRDTGLKHRDGTISMARSEPNTAQDEFFICLGDQPELDFGGKRNPDGQGFAAFGRVVRGMEVVRKIQQAPAKAQSLTPAVPIEGVTITPLNSR